MRALFACLVLLTIPCQLCAAAPREEEHRAADYSDLYGSASQEITLAHARELLLDLVNAERAQAGLGELDPAPLPEQLAQEHADDMAAQDYISHADRRGRKCEQRYNLLGGTDHVAENVALYEISARVYLTPRLVRRLHRHWMESASHRRAILDTHSTHAGFGLALRWDGRQMLVAGVEEFACDYGDYDPLPSSIELGGVLRVSGQLDPVVRLVCIGLAREDLPHGTRPYVKWAEGYSQPRMFATFLPSQYEGQRSWELPDPRYSVQYNESSPQFRASIQLAGGSPPGDYYFTVWVENANGAVFRASTQVVEVNATESHS